MKTNLCHVLGIEHPIIAAPMGPDLTGPELVAAVSNAGGLGILQAQFCSPPVFRQEIRRVRALTARPFGVNLLLHFPVADQVAICLEERVPILSLFWGDPMPYVGRAHAAGVPDAAGGGNRPRGDGVHDSRDQGQGGDFSGHVAARLDALRDDDVHPRGGRPAGIRDRADLMEDLHARRMGTPHVRRRITPEQGEDGHPLFQADGDLIRDGEVE